MCTFTQERERQHRDVTSLAADTTRNEQFIPNITGISYGCDYNPEQWDEATWREDARLMNEAGVNLVAINIFGWAKIQPNEDTFNFENLDKIMDLLHEHGISVNLGTGTASTPAWLTTKHPEILPIMADGTTRYPGGRQAWCPSSPVYQKYALALVNEVARRYSSHPALVLWHVSNELGCHNSHCYNPESAESFRLWLKRKYGTIERLNDAWGTAFWSQAYGQFEEILPPMANLSTANPSQLIDFHRFSSDEILGLYNAEREVIKKYSTMPITTNFMVTAHIRNLNYWSWAPDMDIIANDHYLDNRLEAPTAELSFAADLTRGLAGGKPWILMEHSTGAVNWQPLNISKVGGEMLRNSLTHVARGADSVCFFQWRASIQGSEKFHSAMLPHAGTETARWAEVKELGAATKALAEIAGSTVRNKIAMVFEWESWWASEGESRPSQQVTYLHQIHKTHRSLRALGHAVDVVSANSDFSGYDLVILPGLYMMSPQQISSLEEYVAGGGNTIVTYYSGIADQEDRVYLGGYPGGLRNLLGVNSHEFFPIDKADTVTLSTPDGTELEASYWSEDLHLTGAQALYTLSSGPLAGTPAITANNFGSGTAWYIATDLTDSAMTQFLGDTTQHLAIAANTQTYLDLPNATDSSEIEVIVRANGEHDYVFVINHSTNELTTRITGRELLTGTTVTEPHVVPAGAVRVYAIAHSKDEE